MKNWETRILHLSITLCLLGLLQIKTFALNYTITFSGTGASNSVDNVTVKNLTQGTSITVPAGNVLNLSDGLNAVEQVTENDETIHVYPVPVNGKSMVSFFAKHAGRAQISAFSIDGRKLVGISTDLQAGSNTFNLSLPKGIFVIQVTGNEYAYTAKMLNPTGTQGKPEIGYISTEKPISMSPLKSKSLTQGITTMIYSAGDRLLYKAVSGKCSTIVTDVPTSSKTTNFYFVACTDADGNSYSVVTIDNQTWMAENLKTTKYNDGTAIPFVTDNKAWYNLHSPGYCWYNNYSTSYENMYGALYNGYTVNTGKLAPTGWHISTDEDWTTLEIYLIANGFNFDGSTLGDYYAKSLASTSYWTTSTVTGAIGNDLSKNNSTGFSALPGGFRAYNGFYSEGKLGYWWNSSKGNAGTYWIRALGYDGNDLGRKDNDNDIDSNYQGFSVRCVNDIQPLPTLTTTTASIITTTTATTGGNVTNDGVATIVTRGVCWSISENPTIANSHTTDGTGGGKFTSIITGLVANTTYNMRAYATNREGTAYGLQVSFTTSTPSSYGNTITDIDGNVYNTVVIGTQTWMVENLKTTKYNDGTVLPIVTDNTAWVKLSTGAYCNYNNNEANGIAYGHLYNWYAVNTGKLAPAGWHVPTDDEWTILENYVKTHGTSGSVGKALAATTSWNASTSTIAIGNDLTKNNSSGFSALPGCGRNSSGFIGTIGEIGYWQSSTNNGTIGLSNSRSLRYNFSSLLQSDVSYSYNFSYKYDGLSVRCIKDN